MNFLSKRLFTTTSSNKESILKLLDKKIKAKKTVKLTQEDIMNPEYNTQVLQEMLKDFKEDLDQNDYVSLIKKMKTLKENEEKILDQDELMKTLEDLAGEQSDLEFGKKEKVKLIRPPKTTKEAIQTLKEADARYLNNKQFLFGANYKEKPKEKNDKSVLEFTPKGITLSRLYYPTSSSEIILIGLKRRAYIHSSYLYDLLIEMKPESVFVQLPPDLPMFIRPQNKDHQTAWFHFLKRAKDSSFYLNPRPKFTSDAILNKEKLNQLLENVMIPAFTDFEIGSNCIYSLGKSIDDVDLKPDAFLTPFLYSHNSLDSNIQLLMGDKPMLIQRDHAGRQLSINQAKLMFEETCDQWENENLAYNPQLKYKEIFVDPRVNYMVEILRQLAHVSKTIVAVVDHDLQPYIEDRWKALRTNLVGLDTFMKLPVNKQNNPMEQDTFLEFIEKQVIMDVLFEPFLYRNFIQHNSFPFDPNDFLGKETAVLNYFTFWKHYQSKYLQKLKRVAILEEEYEKYKREEGERLK